MGRETCKEIVQMKAFATAMALRRGGVAASAIPTHLSDREWDSILGYVLDVEKPAPGEQTWYVEADQPGYVVYTCRVRDPQHVNDVPAGGAIFCRACGMRSFSPHDVEQRYCGMCHKFHLNDGARIETRTANCYGNRYEPVDPNPAATARRAAATETWLERCLRASDPLEAAMVIRTVEASRTDCYSQSTITAFRRKCVDRLSQRMQLDGASSVDAWDFRLKLEIELGLRETPPAKAPPPAESIDDLVAFAPADVAGRRKIPSDSIESLLQRAKQRVTTTPFALDVARLSSTTEPLR